MAETKDKLVTLEDLKEAYDNTVHIDDNYVRRVKGNTQPDSEYKTGDVILAPGDIGAKPLQTAKADPSAQGFTTQFIATLSQDSTGVITATKKTVPSASTTFAGLMSSTDKSNLDKVVSEAQRKSIGSITTANDNTLYGSGFVNGSNVAGLPSTNASYELLCFGNVQLAIQYNAQNPSVLYKRYYVNSRWYDWAPIISNITGIKGNAENAYRTGDVNLTPSNIGAHPANTALTVKNNSAYSGNTSSSASVAEVSDSSGTSRHWMSGGYNANTGMATTYLTANWPGIGSNNFAVQIDKDGNHAYSVTDPAAFTDAIDATPVVLLSATNMTDLYNICKNLKENTVYTARITAGAASTLSGKSIQGSGRTGLISRNGNDFYFTVFPTGSQIVLITINGWTAASTYTGRSAYRFNGTAIT